MLFIYITCYSLSTKAIEALAKLRLFQYITCYSLSQWINIITNIIVSFNTSHVTLYPWSWPGRCSRRNVSIHHMLLFIESRDARTRRTFMVSIHHMLLFIDGCLCCYARPYQVSIHHMLLFIEKRREDTWSGWCFNTSHVTLYHKWCWSLYRKKHVSIHHMLLFIWKVVWSWANLLRFNTSHVTLYHNRGHCYNGVYLVSIHHMLLFIKGCYWC